MKKPYYNEEIRRLIIHDTYTGAVLHVRLLGLIFLRELFKPLNKLF